LTRNDLIEELKAFVIDNDLPKTDMSLFGLGCPYCGKSDQIRQLETPQDLTHTLSPETIEIYSGLWQRVNPDAPSLGVCKFCQNPLALFLAKGHVETLIRF
jgi:hypothetical protein